MRRGARSHGHRFYEFGPLLALLGLFDVAGIVAAGLVSAPLANLVRAQTVVPLPIGAHYVVAISMACAVALGVMSWMGAYRPRRGMSLRGELRIVWFALVGVFVWLAVLALATKSGAVYSRSWFVLWFALSAGLLSFWRVGLRWSLRGLRRRGFDSKRIVLVGGGSLAATVSANLKASPWSGFEVVGYFASDEMFADADAEGLPYLGSLEDVNGYVNEHRERVDQVWIAMPMTAGEQIAKLLDRLRQSTIDIRLVPDVFAYQLLSYSVDEIVGLPVLNISYSPCSGQARYLKHAGDKVVALAMIAVTSPLLLLIAAAIKLTSTGPVLFKQLRHGWDGRPITVFKFRTMRHAAEAPTCFDQATRSDPRITRLGAFLRRTSLDELPQLFNVLFGDMSIVGPRPHPMAMNELYRNELDRYMLRHKVKPGITGWAQANGYRGETDTRRKIEKRLEYDLYYIENWSFRFDLQIILLTLVRGIFSRNAY